MAQSQTEPLRASRRERLAAARRVLRDALRGVEADYTSGSIRRAVVLLAVPMMLEMAMESIFAITDIFFVSALGADAVATVGLTEAVLTLVYAVAIGLGMGATALVARRIGEGDGDGAARVAGQTLWIGALTAAGVGALGVWLAADVLRWMGASEGVVAIGSPYTAIMLGGTATIVFLFLINAVFRGAGDPSVAMRALFVANGINVVLDPCLIFGIGPFPELGLTGAAIASNTGRGIGVLYLAWRLFSGSGHLRMRHTHLALAPAVLRGLVAVSAGGMLQFLVATASWIAMMRLVSVYGSAAIAGYTIAIRIAEVTFLPAWGLSNAASTLVGQNLGAGKPDRARESVRQTARYNATFMGTVAVLMIAFAAPLAALFASDAEVLRHARVCLVFFALGFPVFAVGMVLTNAFNGAGDTWTPTGINFVCFWLVQIPLAWTLSQRAGFGPDGVFAAVTAAESLVALLAWRLFRTGRWQTRRV